MDENELYNEAAEREVDRYKQDLLVGTDLGGGDGWPDTPEVREATDRALCEVRE